ncbi:hypothetical protein RV12_GL001084 [Enterococcus quebecensis]|nr:hypothetical protein RV12_GL001084 [Enterococcus quebecensis]
MVSIFLYNIKQEKEKLKKEGQQKYSTGMLYYKYDQTTLNFRVRLDQTQATYQFQENYPKVEKIRLKYSKGNGY